MSKNNGTHDSDEQKMIDLLNTVRQLYAYTRAAVDREVVHTLNNRLTYFSGQIVMLKLAVQKGDRCEIMSRIEGLEEASGNIQDYMKALGMENQTNSSLKIVALNNFLGEAVENAKIFPRLSHIQIKMELSPEVGLLEVDPDALQVLIIAYLHATRSHFALPDVLFETFLDPETGETIFSVTSSEGAAGVSLNCVEPISRKVGKDLGEIPLRTMKYITESMCGSVTIKIVEQGEIGFKCTFERAHEMAVAI